VQEGSHRTVVVYAEMACSSGSSPEDSFKKKKERKTMSRESLTLEELREMQGQPVWCPELNSYGIIKCDTSGKWKGIPYIHGSQFIPEYGISTDFEYNIQDRSLVCQRVPPNLMNE
jgi:hypothetical protein